jgi:[acyl-carrier-protein] S-malonyltransferase
VTAQTAKTAVVFPGQGSQFVGMGRDLHEAFSEVRALFGQASRILGFDLAALCFNGPEEELSQTRVTQPAIFVHSVAAFRLLQAKGLSPDMVAGHSLGEYSALTAAGYLDFEEAVSLVGLRGELMQSAGEKSPGTMAAVIGLEFARVEELCASATGTVVPANINAPGQVVVSGSLDGVEQVMEAARQAGARLVKKLKVSGAFHSPLMAFAAGPMAKRLEKTRINPAGVPLVPNVTARSENDPERIRTLLVEQITSPVRWAESVEEMAARGVKVILEVGPGNVLAGLCRRISKDLEITSIGTLDQVNAWPAR